MSNLIINRIKYKLDTPQIFYLSTDVISLFKKKVSFFKVKINNHEREKFVKWCGDNSILDDSYIYYNFHVPSKENYICIEFINSVEEQFIKYLLIEHFKNHNLIVNSNPRYCDLSVYRYLKDYNDAWSYFQQIDIVIKNKKRSELSLSIGSNAKLISKQPFLVKSDMINIKGLDHLDDDIKPLKHIHKLPVRIIANRELRKLIGVEQSITKFNYKDNYTQIYNFFNSYLKTINSESISFYGSGLLNVNDSDCYKVDSNQNKMLFGNGKTDINTITGIRDFGVYKVSPNAFENKFLFIYQTRDDANNLYKYFKNGFKHFPGLERYVGLPVTLDLDNRLNYTNVDTLKKEFDEFLAVKLIENNYNNLFAVIISPFNREDSEEVESNLYYYIKEKLLQKGIPSQFISYHNIRKSNSFHFHLPNIAIGMLAKLGGIPWRLKQNVYNELIIGFNQIKNKNEKFIGSSVFFTNEGYLEGVHAYPESESADILIAHLKSSISKYIEKKGETPTRLVIHYYKPNNKMEKDRIQFLLDEELNLKIPFAIVEINDSTNQTDMCFDFGYNLGMPESGIYIRTGYNEYLLFNNTRYQQKPLRQVEEVLPIKVKVHFADSSGFSHKELISQVYEFSRLYWKGLKQRSQPVTTIYAKLIADYSAHFSENLPDNKIANNTPWFL